MRDISGILVRLIRLGWTDKSFPFCSRNQLADIVAFFRRDTETFPQTLISHVVVHEIAQAGVEIAGMDALGRGHGLEFLVGKKDGACVFRDGLEDGCRKLEDFGLMHDLVDAGAALFTDPNPAHEGSERFVARLWRRVEKAVRFDEGDAGVGDFESTIENLDHRTGACLEEILVNEGVGDEFSNGDLGKHRYVFAKGRAEHFVVRDASIDEVDQPFESVGVSTIAHLLVEGFNSIPHTT